MYDRARLEREHEVMKSFAACLRASSVFVLSMKSNHVIFSVVSFPVFSHITIAQTVLLPQDSS